MTLKEHPKRCEKCGIEWKDAISKHFNTFDGKYYCDKCIGCNPIMRELRLFYREGEKTIPKGGKLIPRK